MKDKKQMKKALNKDQILTVLMTQLQETETSRALEAWFSDQAEKDGDKIAMKKANAEHAIYFFQEHFLSSLIHEILGKSPTNKYPQLDKYDLLLENPSDES